MTNTFIGVGTLTTAFQELPGTNRQEAYLQVIDHNKINLLPVTIDAKTILPATSTTQPLQVGDRVTVAGSVRSYRVKDNNGKWCNKIHVHAKSIERTTEDKDSAYVHIVGRVILTPFTTTKGGHKVAQTLIHTEIAPGRWYHIPVTAWNTGADYLGACNKGQLVDIVGNLISRTYNKYRVNPDNPDGLSTCDTLVTREVIVSRVIPVQEEE